MTQQTQTAVRFTAEVFAIDSSVLARLPKDASEQLPSRGQVAVRGSIDGHEFETVLEPDGMKGHWLRVDQQLQDALGVGPGDSIDVALEVSRDWPEPEVPSDLSAALSDAPTQIQDVWTDITPMARWEWVRWVNATANPNTRQRRVDVSISKMGSGKRRPCCFDLASCTDPSVAKSGKLRTAP